MASALFDGVDRGQFASVSRSMDDLAATAAIRMLCTYLEKYYGKKPIILLDEYDTPMQEAWLHGCMAVGGKQ